MTYVDDLSKWVKERDKARKRTTQGLAKVGFLAVRQDVLDGLEAGYSTKTIWQHLHEKGRYGFGYVMFRSYVNRELEDQKVAASRVPTSALKTAPVMPESRSPAAPPLDTSKSKSDGSKPKDFVFSAVPNKKDLI